MNMKDMLEKISKLDEAGTQAGSFGMYADSPENSDTGEESDSYKELTKNVPKAPTAPAASQSLGTQNSATSQQAATTMPQGSEQPGQTDTKKLDLLKKLNDVMTKLWQLNKGSIESGKYESLKTDIAKSLMEAFDIFEDPAQLSMTGERAKLVADANEIVKQLEPYKSHPDVAQALAKLQQASATPKQAGPMYAVDQTKIKRFQELMAKAQGSANIAQPAKPAATKAATGAAGQPATNMPPEKVKQLQQALNMAGEKLRVDGIIGKNTSDAMHRHLEVTKQFLAGE